MLGSFVQRAAAMAAMAAIDAAALGVQGSRQLDGVYDG
jgi:hypothetical protein